jgi:hypothetical protein
MASMCGMQWDSPVQLLMRGTAAVRTSCKRHANVTPWQCLSVVPASTLGCISSSAGTATLLQMLSNIVILLRCYRASAWAKPLAGRPS